MSQSSIVFINLNQVTVAEASVPVTFMDEDILHYILVEQAQLFPMLDRAIYYDFLVKSVSEDRKAIIIVACNVKDFLYLDASVTFLKVAHEDFNALNLLPWRQREKDRARKKEIKLFGIVAILTSVFMLIVSLFYLHLKHEDVKRAHLLTQKKQHLLSKLVLLEESREGLSAFIASWKNQIDIAHHQSHLERMLVMIESQRSANMVLEEIVWKSNKLLIKGVSKDASVVKEYMNQLQENKIAAHLKFMGHAVDQIFSVQFHLEAEDIVR